MKKSYKKMIALILILTMALAAVGCKKDEEKPADNQVVTDDSKKSDDATNKESADTNNDGAAEGEAVTETGEVTPGWQLNADDKVDLTWYINFSWFTTHGEKT